MATKRITERVLAPFAGARVDRAAGTIAGVLICGTTSANGRDYPPAVFRRDFALYEGRPVNCDHGREATVDRRFGWFAGVAPGEDGRPRGTLHCLKSHPMFERVMEAAERNPALFGFSHVAHCETRTERGREVVEAIRRVESVDLVAEPATTQGLFEHLKRKVREMDGEGDPVKDGFKAAALALFDKALSGEIDVKECLKKIRQILNTHGDVSDGTDDETDDDDVLDDMAEPNPDGIDPDDGVVGRTGEGRRYRRVRTAEQFAASVRAPGLYIPPPAAAARRPAGTATAPARVTEARVPRTADEFAASIRG